MKNRWKTASIVWVGCWFLAVSSVLSQSDLLSGMEDSDQVTVITSEKLTFDYKQKFALFEDDVVAVDPQMKLTCNKLVVWFDKDGEAKVIKAEGNVRMAQDDKVAESGEAVYDLRKRKVVLTKSPRVQQGRDFLEGTVITYHMDAQVMVCEPQAKLVMFPSGDGPRERVLPR